MKKKKETNWSKIKKISASLLWQNKLTAVIIYSSLGLNALVWLLSYLLMKNSQGILIGHYNVFFGVDKIIDLSNGVGKLEIFLSAMGGFFLILLTIVMSIFLTIQFDEEKIARDNINFISNKSISFVGSRLLLINSWLLQLILIIYLIAISRVN